MELYKDKDFLYNEYIIKKKTKKQISEEIGCNRKTLDNWMNKFNIESREFNINVYEDIYMTDMIKLFEDGLFYKDIAKQLDIPKHYVIDFTKQIWFY